VLLHIQTSRVWSCLYPNFTGRVMSAIAEMLSTNSSLTTSPSDKPICVICSDTLVAAEASALLADNEVTYLWTCDTCGCGFVTKHAATKAFACDN
jgi:predicted RNA-binding Zn ribbon-like protein